MNKKEEFKSFIKKNPEFIEAVKSNSTSWQKLYEIYDIYGEDNEIWKNVIKKEDKKVTDKKDTLGIKDIINSLKSIDVDALQESLNSIGKAASFLDELTTKTVSDIKKKSEVKKKETTIERFFDD